MSESPQEPVEGAGLPEPLPDPAEGLSGPERGSEGVAGEVEDFKPSGADLVVADPGDEAGVFVVLDRHDEAMILDEFQRRALDVMLYDFPQGGQRVVDLSVQGVNECIRLMNNTGKCSIAIDREAGVEWERELMDTDFAPGVKHITATVFARDARTGYGQYGTFSQPTQMKLTDRTLAARRKAGKFVPEDGIMSDPFARQKALNKAQRNALRAMIPEALRQTLIAQYRGDDVAVRRIRAGAGASKVAELPAPLTDERAEGLRARAREVFSEIQGYSRTRWLLPGAFDAQLTRAEWSHERLEEFIARLEGLRDKARGEAEGA